MNPFGGALNLGFGGSQLNRKFGDFVKINKTVTLNRVVDLDWRPIDYSTVIGLGKGLVAVVHCRSTVLDLVEVVALAVPHFFPETKH